MRGFTMWYSVVALALTAVTAAAQSTTALDAGRKLFDAGQLVEAAKVLEPIGATDGAAALLLCRIAHAGRKSDDAVKWGERAVALTPNLSSAHVWLGRAYVQQLEGASILRQPGIAGRARARYDRAVELDSTNFDARESRATYYMHAPAIAGGGMDKARAEAEVARRLNPYRGAVLRGDIEERDKKVAAAEAEFAALVRAYPDSTLPFSRLVNLYQVARRFSDAFAAIDARLARLPGDVAAQYQIGKTAALSGERLDQGEAALRAFIQAGRFTIAPEANARYRLGAILEHRKDTSGAIREYQRAIELEPRLEDAKAALKRLQRRTGPS